MKKITIENAAYKWFDMKLSTYDKLETDDFINLYYTGQDYAEIVISNKYRNIYFNLDFWEEFYEIIPMELDEFQDVISKWADDTFNLKGFTHRFLPGGVMNVLKLPK